MALVWSSCRCCSAIARWISGQVPPHLGPVHPGTPSSRPGRHWLPAELARLFSCGRRSPPGAISSRGTSCRPGRFLGNGHPADSRTGQVRAGRGRVRSGPQRARPDGHLPGRVGQIRQLLRRRGRPRSRAAVGGRACEENARARPRIGRPDWRLDRAAAPAPTYRRRKADGSHAQRTAFRPGPFEMLSADPMARPFLATALTLLQAVISVSQPPPQS